MELQGQVAIVTGAGHGIDRATGLDLARRGADIVVAELDAATAEHTASEVPQCLTNLHRRNHKKPPGIYWGQVTDETFHRVNAHFAPPQPGEGFRILTHITSENR
jgi:NAD(P)-dependent dehydrogenase (short-subunit alcohol dehydrogenase family)